jgi:hypothetical protein
VLHAAGLFTQRQLARMYGVTTGGISAILRNKVWKV